MLYSAEVENMCPVAKGAYHGPAPIPQEGKWTHYRLSAEGQTRAVQRLLALPTPAAQAPACGCCQR